MGDILTEWKVAKTWPSSGFDAIARKDFALDTEDKFAASERRLSRGENFDDDIFFKHKNSIDVEEKNNKLPYAEGGEEYAGEFDYESESKQEYSSVEPDNKYQDADGISLKSNSVGVDNGDFASVSNSSKSSLDDDSDNSPNVQPTRKKWRHGILSAKIQETQTDKNTFGNDTKTESNNKKSEGVTLASMKKPPQHNKSNDRNDMLDNLFIGDLKEEVGKNVKKLPVRSQFQFTSGVPFATVKLARATGLRFMETVVPRGCSSLNSSEAT